MGESLVDLREFDFRYSWTRETLEALDRGMEKLSSQHDDGLNLLEHAEDLVGLGFVALQGYVSSTQTTLRTVFPPLDISNKRIRAKNCQPCQRAAGVTQIEAIWATANYYKHHDEWPNWKPEGQRRPTIVTLGKLGISETTEFPCVDSMKLLHGDWAPLVSILDVASAWREAWLSELRLGSPPSELLRQT
jgi:hypothetical protein